MPDLLSHSLAMCAPHCPRAGKSLRRVWAATAPTPLTEPSWAPIPTSVSLRGHPHRRAPGWLLRSPPVADWEVIPEPIVAPESCSCRFGVTQRNASQRPVGWIRRPAWAASPAVVRPGVGSALLGRASTEDQRREHNAQDDHERQQSGKVDSAEVSMCGHRRNGSATVRSARIVPVQVLAPAESPTRGRVSAESAAARR